MKGTNPLIEERTLELCVDLIIRGSSFVRNSFLDELDLFCSFKDIHYGNPEYKQGTLIHLIDE